MVQFVNIGGEYFFLNKSELLYKLQLQNVQTPITFYRGNGSDIMLNHYEC